MARTKGAGPSRAPTKAPKKKKRVASPQETEESERHGPDYSSRNFVSKDAHDQYLNRYANKKVLPGKVLDVRFFRNFPMYDWLRIQGWLELMGRKLPYYPNLVRLFYSNMSIVMEDGEEVLSSYVKGIHFRLTAVDIEQILDIRSSANVPERYIHPSQAKAELLGMNVGARRPQASSLDEDTRLVMHLVNWIIRPVSGHLTTITSVMSMIVHNIKFGNYANLGKIMISHMASLKNHKAGHMPYGRWLTLIFQTVGIELEGEIKLELEEPYGTVGELTLRNMGLEPNEEGIWRRKPGAVRDPAPMEVGDDEEQEQEDQEGDEADPRGTYEDPGMRAGSSAGGDMAYMARFDALQEDMRAVREEVRSSREAQDELARTVHEYHAQMEMRFSSFDSFTASFNQFVQGYMAQHPSEFPPPPPPE